MDPSKKAPKAKAKAATKAAHSPCALFYPKENYVIGGQNMGFPDNLRLDFLISNTKSKLSRSYLALGIRFPRFADDVASYFRPRDGSPSPDLQVTVRFFPGTFTVKAEPLADDVFTVLQPTMPIENRMCLVHLTMVDDQKPSVDGLGLPFRGETPEIDSYINLGAKIQGFRTLREILNQTSFCFLFKDSHIMARAKEQFVNSLAVSSGPTYPYGNE
jgi:hypothetical protein